MSKADLEALREIINNNLLQTSIAVSLVWPEPSDEREIFSVQDLLGTSDPGWLNCGPHQKMILWMNSPVLQLPCAAGGSTYLRSVEDPQYIGPKLRVGRGVLSSAQAP